MPDSKSIHTACINWSNFLRAEGLLLSVIVALPACPTPCYATDRATAALPSTGSVTDRKRPVEFDPEGHPVNDKYTPLMLRGAAAQRGYLLSGNAQLYEKNANHYELGSGCVLMHTAAPMRVDTRYGSIYTESHAAVVVNADKNVTRVLNISDRKRDSVRVVVGKHFVSLSPGQEMGIVSVDIAEPEQTVAGGTIGYRQLKVLPLGPDYKAVLFEFSLADALKHCYIFRQLRESPNEVDHDLLAEIVKTAAAVDTMYEKTRQKYAHRNQDGPGSGKPKAQLAGQSASVEK